VFKRFITTILALGLATAQNAVAPQASDLLDKARLAHGGSALENLKLYRETTDVTYYAPNGNPAVQITAVSTADFSGERLRLEVFQGETLIEIDQVAPTEAWSWTKQTGTINLPNVQARPLRESLYQGWYGLRFGGKNRDAVSLDGAQGFADQKGQAVTVTTRGVKATYLLSPDGLLMAEKSQLPQVGEIVTVYGAYQTVDGVQIPFEGVGYVGTKKFFMAKVRNAKVNPALSDADFARVK
jgi:hypothetical protein